VLGVVVVVIGESRGVRVVVRMRRGLMFGFEVKIYTLTNGKVSVIPKFLLVILSP
jgi:hypothetical protein